MRRPLSLLVLAALAAPLAAQPAAVPKPDKFSPEAARMLAAIEAGSMMGPGEGWFGPPQTRYTWPWLVQAHGLDAKARELPKKAFRGTESLFARLDRNRDGAIQPGDLDWSDDNPYVQMAYTLNRVFRRMDAKGAGKLTRAEWDAFFDRAAGGKGHITASDLSDALLAGYSGGSFSPGDAPNKDVLVRGLYAGEIGSLQEGPAVGGRAPDFSLPRANGPGRVALKPLLGNGKPVVLVTGNFTCGPFRAFYPAIEEVYARHKDAAHFVMVYVREAHPTDGWAMESNARAGVTEKQPRTDPERAAVAGRFCAKLSPTIPVGVDGVDDAVGNAYSGMPARLYVIDPDGTVVYKSGRGPFGFRPGEMEQALAMCLVERSLGKDKAMNTGADVWERLPKADVGQGAPLPNWVAPVAAHLPRTAAAMLELDYAQRVRSPLDPALRASMRWVVARENRCAYAQAVALADLRRVAGRRAEPTESDAEALELARLLTVSASEIPDALFAKLRDKYGDKKVAAMVLLAAYGNFQDRILLGLGVAPEAGGPLAPLEVKFAAGAFQSAPLLPPQGGLPKLMTGGESVVPRDPEWGALSFDVLQARLERQKERAPRLPIPAWDEVKKGLPPEFAARPTRILWNLVCSGYVPELAVPWGRCTRTMWAEAAQDRVFEESLFWVQTRAVRCNYCMGHCEMLLGVAGLDARAVAERTRALASDDWSAFPPAEQRAYAYARTLTRTPWTLAPADYAALERDLGPKPAMAVFWWLCRGLYMTRVSDGFALPLERDNVFADYPAKK